jgi:hypothetical protein
VQAIVVACGLLTANAAAAPRPVAEIALQGKPDLPKWFSDSKPLFGDYVASGDGSASGALAGRFGGDLYEDGSRDDRHPAFFRGFIERDGHRILLEIIGVYTPLSADRQRWQLSGAITFDDDHLLGTSFATITGTFEAKTDRAHYTVWVDR